MPFTTWIRDLFGIRKDVIDAKKAKLEITKLEAEERERDLITPATLEDVKSYDPKYSRIRRAANRGKHEGVYYNVMPRWLEAIGSIGCLLSVISLVIYLAKVILRLIW